jgi:hypothetical protein
MVGGPVRQPYAGDDFIPQSMNSATGLICLKIPTKNIMLGLRKPRHTPPRANSLAGACSAGGGGGAMHMEYQSVNHILVGLPSTYIFIKMSVNLYKKFLNCFLHRIFSPISSLKNFYMERNFIENLLDLILHK